VCRAIPIGYECRRLLGLARVFRRWSETEALTAIGLLRVGNVIELDAPLALAAARLGADLKLPLADSVVLAMAQRSEALLWTQDSDFEGLANVRYRAHRAG